MDIVNGSHTLEEERLPYNDEAEWQTGHYDDRPRTTTTVRALRDDAGPPERRWGVKTPMRPVQILDINCSGIRSDLVQALNYTVTV